MPVVNKPFPVLPSLVARADFAWNYQILGQPGKIAGGSTTFYWLMSNPTPGGWNKNAWGPVMLNFWQSVINPWASDDVTYQFGWAFMNDAGTSRSVFVTSNIPGPRHGTFVMGELCAMISKSTTVPGRNGKGRNFLPPIPKQYLDKQGYTTAGYALIANAVNTINTPIVDQGVTYSPAVYFPSLTSAEPCVGCHLLRRPTQLRRRHLRLVADYLIYFYPLVG